MNFDSSRQIGDYDSALQSLKGEVLQMAQMAQQGVDRSVRALLERDVELCRKVIKGDSRLDEAERRIDQMGMDTIVRFQPVATDLRLVLASMRISTNLERISDHAVGIARRVRKLLSGPELPEVTFVENLYSKAAELLRAGTAAYADGNVDLGVSLAGRDKELDRVYKRLVATLSQRIAEGLGGVEGYLHLIFVLRSLERIGDLSVNIGEDAVFIKAAKDIRHGHPLDEDEN